MTVNFRSRGEVLDAMDLTFEGLWGDDFDALVARPGARAPNSPGSPLASS